MFFFLNCVRLSLVLSHISLIIETWECGIDKATEHKRILEERQRSEERHRAETETVWRTRYFDREVSNSTTVFSDSFNHH